MHTQSLYARNEACNVRWRLNEWDLFRRSDSLAGLLTIGPIGRKRCAIMSAGAWLSDEAKPTPASQDEDTGRCAVARPLGAG